ncbi:MAG: hypothetical protein KGL39_10205 [Patescibacteria group bacterium]|nr:hypothetical protein [Patescibacteria group bacterium]
MGKLSFAIEMVGGDEVEARLQRIVSLQSKIGLSGSGSGVGGTQSSGRSHTKKLVDETREYEKALWRMAEAKRKINIIDSSVGKAPNPADVARTQSLWDATQQRMLKRGLIPVSGGMGVSPEDREKSIKKEAMEARRLDQLKSDARRKELDHARFMKDMTFSLMPIMNPGSLWGTLFGARQTFSAFMTESGQEKIGKFGLKGVGGAGAAMGIWMGALTAAGFALKGFTIAVGFASDEIKKAFAFAHTLYAKAISSGLPMGFTAQRSITAGVMGIDEKDVFRSRASIEVMRQLQGSINEIAKDAPILNYTSVQFKVLQTDILAVGSSLATQLTPALNGLINILDVFVKHFDGWFSTMKKIWMFTGLAGPIIGMTFWKNTLSQFQKGGAHAMNTLGTPDAQMKQLATSSWEKMGLVVSGGIGNNTNDLIRKSNGYLKKISDSISTPSGIPRAMQFGLSPLVANP